MRVSLRKGICTKDGNIKKSHQYYYQIQQQEFVVNRQWCDFVVRGSSEEIYCKRVPYDPPWWHGGIPITKPMLIQYSFTLNAITYAQIYMLCKMYMFRN